MQKTSSEGLEPSISRFVVSRLIQLGHEDIALNEQQRASMAEWSKALDLSSSIRKNAWVRTPLEAYPFASYKHKSSWPNWIRRETTNLEIEGSSPSEDALQPDARLV